MKKILLCSAMVAFGAVAQETAVVSADVALPLAENQGAEPVVVKTDAEVFNPVAENAVPANELAPVVQMPEDPSMAAPETQTAEAVKAVESAVVATEKPKVEHPASYKPYALGDNIEQFFASLQGTTIGDFVIQQYYQPADDNTRHCFILLSDAQRKKVKKCVQLEPTVSFQEDDLYAVLGE